MHTIDATIRGPHCLLVIDMDHDGDIDAASCAKDDRVAAWFENDGQGGFTTHVVGRNQAAYDIRAVDMEGDGDLDLLIAGQSSNNVVWYESIGGDFQVPGDCNQDAALNVSDVVCTLLVLFSSVRESLPCGDGTETHPGNVALMDWQPDGSIDISDAVGMIGFVFGTESAHPLAAPGAPTTECVTVPGCGASNSICP